MDQECWTLTDRATEIKFVKAVSEYWRTDYIINQTIRLKLNIFNGPYIKS
jgi:hypothetical protein